MPVENGHTVTTMTPPTFHTFEDAYVAVLEHVADHYEYTNAPRGNASRECLNMSFTLADPIDRVPYLASRKVNIVFHFAEALWYLWGRNDLEMISYYAPQMRSYSIDGKTLRGSAYGSRLFRQQPGAECSSFDQVLDLIREDSATKRAVMTMFRPEELAVPGNVDVACVIALQFLLRDGKLHAICFMRANDAGQGLLSDVFSFTLIQEFAARQLNVPVGTYTHHVGSMHIGDRDIPLVRRVLDEVGTRDLAGPRFRFSAMPNNASWNDLEALQVHEDALRTNRDRLTPGTIASTGLHPYWQQILLLFEAQRQIVHQAGQRLDAEVLAALSPGFRWLMEHRWPDRVPVARLAEGTTNS